MLAADQPPQRADSLRSVDSAASSASLSRKPRTTKQRSRSRSAAADTRRSLSIPGDANDSMSDELFASYSSLKSRSAGHSPLNSPDFNPPPNAQFSSSFPFLDSAQPRPSSAEPTVSQPKLPHLRGRHQIPGPSKVQASRRPRSLPRRAMGSVSSNSSQGPPTPVEFSMSKPNRPRDSLQSGTSSSLYPASTYISSPMDRALSPQSHFEQMPEVVEVPTLAENESGYRDFDTDDVSLRLRLLVNNSYFLPPAHSKPTIADLSNSDAAKRAPKPINPGFFDMFRIGKAKSKPTTPVTPEPPRLRATSESNTLNVFSNTDSTPGASTPQKPVEIPARVMVVREKMDDLMIAARKAEHDSKIRAERLAELQEHHLDQPEQFDGIIDPTDAVDLPPPSTKYPFAIQASVAQGLGVNESIGAAVLADRLPPPRSPGLWSVTEEDEKWRKLLLTQAVGHSLSNTPDSWASRTPVRRPPRSSSIPTTTPRSPLSPTPQSSSPTPQTQPFFSEPILLPDALRERLQQRPSLAHLTPSPKPQPLHLDRKNSAPEVRNAPSPLSPRSPYDPPVRAETPVAPTFPLSPPPRATTTGPGSPGVRLLVNPIYSLSQSDLGDDEGTGIGASSSPTSSSGNDQTGGLSVQEILSGQHKGEELRRVESILAQAAQTAQSTRSMKAARSTRSMRQTAESERQPDVQENEVDVDAERTLMGPPPSVPPVTIEPATISPRHTLGAASEVGTNSQFDDEDTEEWFGLHDDSGSRDSSGAYPRTRSMLSYLAPPSPTVSAFYDAVEGMRDSESSPAAADTDVGTSSGPETFVTADTRTSGVYSPPPRQSTCISPQPLPPPPRRRLLTGLGIRRPSTLRQEPITIWEPEPSTPPLPSLSGERRGTGFSLDIPRLPERGELSRAVAEETAQGNEARMSISFFDNIQSDLNQLDESSSSEEESETDSDLGEPVEAPVFRNPDTQAISIPGRRSISSTTARPVRPTLMRLGNNSTPQLGSSTSSGSSFNQMRSDYPLFDPASFRGPIGNTPVTPTTKGSFFTSRTPKKQGVSSEDYHGPKARSMEDVGPSTSNAGSTFLDMESEMASSASSHMSHETEEARKSQDESTKILDGLVLQHLEKERNTIKRITENNRTGKSKR